MEEVKKTMRKAGEAIKVTAQDIGTKAKNAFSSGDEAKHPASSMSDVQGGASAAGGAGATDTMGSKATIAAEECEELKGNNPFENCSKLFDKMVKDFKEVLNCDDESKCQRLFLNAERIYACATACEHEVIYPCIRELARTRKIDKSHSITMEMLLSEHMLFDQELCSLRRTCRDIELIISPGFRGSIQSLMDFFDVHHKKTQDVLKGVEKVFNESELKSMAIRMRDVFSSVPRDPFGSCSQQSIVDIPAQQEALARGEGGGTDMTSGSGMQ